MINEIIIRNAEVVGKYEYTVVVYFPVVSKNFKNEAKTVICLNLFVTIDVIQSH
jgi:hypothetical protein